MMYAFCFQVHMWMPFSPMGAQSLAFASQQALGAYDKHMCIMVIV